MPKVIDTFFTKNESEKPLNTYKIAKSIGSCSPDAGEVVKMLAILTSIGRIESVNGRWRKIAFPADFEILTTGFRKDYIKQMMEILNALPEEFITLPEFVNENNFNVKDIESILLFLKDITQYGRIYLYRKFPQKWAFKTWE